jgi:hypothetical protein
VNAFSLKAATRSVPLGQALCVFPLILCAFALSPFFTFRFVAGELFYNEIQF